MTYSKSKAKIFMTYFLIIAMFIAVFPTIHTNALSPDLNDATELDLVDIAYEIQSTLNINSRSASVSIDILQNTEKIQEVKFTEGNLSNVLLYNRITKELYVDGNLITVEKVNVNNENAQPFTLLPETPKYRYTITLKQPLISFTVSALCAALLLNIPLLSSGLANVLASGLLGAGTSYIATTATICYETWTQLDDSYTWYMKYWLLYRDSSFTSSFSWSYVSREIQGAN